MDEGYNSQNSPNRDIVIFDEEVMSDDDEIICLDDYDSQADTIIISDSDDGPDDDDDDDDCLIIDVDDDDDCLVIDVDPQEVNYYYHLIKLLRKYGGTVYNFLNFRWQNCWRNCPQLMKTKF